MKSRLPMLNTRCSILYRYMAAQPTLSVSGIVIATVSRSLILEIGPPSTILLTLELGFVRSLIFPHIRSTIIINKPLLRETKDPSCL